jgi:pimeloyl-ACP methyl ester carboxylesterase
MEERKMSLVYLTVGGVKTSICKAGAGQAITMIHGAMHNHRIWIHQIGSLSSIGEVYAIDLPGHGASSRFPANRAISIESYSDHVHEVLKDVGRSSTVLVGH